MLSIAINTYVKLTARRAGVSRRGNHVRRGVGDTPSANIYYVYE